MTLLILLKGRLEFVILQPKFGDETFTLRLAYQHVENGQCGGLLHLNRIT